MWPARDCCCCCWVASVVSNSVRPLRRQPPRLPRPWDSPGKNTGVGSISFSNAGKWKVKCEVAQLCPTLRDPMDGSLPGSSVHGIFQVLDWGAIAFSMQGSSLQNLQLVQLYIIRTTTQSKNKQKTQTDISPKKTYRCSRGTWKDVQPHWLLEKCKSKLQWVITSQQPE